MKTPAGGRGVTVKMLSGGELGWRPALMHAVTQLFAVWGERVSIRTAESRAITGCGQWMGERVTT